ncbi:MAG: hypothetical protein AMXMBFR80_24780 [Dehalococcoidia bacterium]
MAINVAPDAVQILAAKADRRDQRVEKWVRHARIVQFLDGTNLVHRMVPGRALAAPPKRG